MKQQIIGVYNASFDDTDYISIHAGSVYQSGQSAGPGLGRSEAMLTVAGTFRHLRILPFTALVGDDTHTFTVLKNGVATSLEVVVNSALGTSIVTDAGNSATFAVGDKYALRRVGANGAPANQFFHFAIEFECTTADTSVYSWGDGNTDTMFDGPEYGSVLSGGGRWLAESQLDVAAVPGSVIGLSYNMATAPGSGKTRTATIMLDGVAQDGSGGTVDTRVTVSDTATSAYSLFTLPFVSGARFSVRYSSTGSPASTGGGGSIAITSSVANTWNICGGTEDSMISGDVVYNYPSGISGVPTSSPIVGISSVTTFSINGLTWAALSAPGVAASGKSWTLKFYHDGSDTAIAAPMVETATTGTVSGSAIPIEDGDTWAVHGIPASSPVNTGPYYWAFSALYSPPVLTGCFILGGTDAGASTVNTTHTGYIALDDVARTVSGEGVAFLGGYLGLIEQAADPAPVANTALIYAKDDGAGKTKLMVQFPTGAAIQLSVEV